MAAATSGGLSSLFGPDGPDASAGIKMLGQLLMWVVIGWVAAGEIMRARGGSDS